MSPTPMPQHPAQHRTALTRELSSVFNQIAFEQLEPNDASDALLYFLHEGIERLAQRREPEPLAHEIHIFEADRSCKHLEVPGRGARLKLAMRRVQQNRRRSLAQMSIHRDPPDAV